MTTVGFLTSKILSASPEELAAWSFLKSRKTIRARRILSDNLQKNPGLLKDIDVLWWHFDSSVEIPNVYKGEGLILVLRDFVTRGGGILLSLLAAPYVADLGLETIRPNVCVRTAWSEQSWASDYPDMRGFGSYKGHPIFKNLPGGAFTWSPVPGHQYAAAYYQNVIPAQGRVIAVEKCYIRLNEDRRIIAEYSDGLGRIVTVGAHLYFSSVDKRFKLQRELLTEQCLVYLKTPASTAGRRGSKPPWIKPTFWTFGSAGVEERPGTKSAMLHGKAAFPRISSDLEIHRDLRGTDRNEFFDITGDRILLMGLERGGLEEIWSHPVRIFHDLKTGFAVDNSEIQWTSTLSPEVSIRPETFSRRYRVDDAIIEETLCADTSDPAAAIGYRISSAKPVEIVITAKVDLRLMWPLSPQATGSLRYHWDSGLNAAIVADESGMLCSVLGSSQRPFQVCLGQHNSVSLVDGSLVGDKTDRAMVALGMRFRVEPGTRELMFFLSGSSSGEVNAVSAYRRIAGNPGRSLVRQVQRFKRFERKSIKIQTPEGPFDDAIRWARWSLGRLFGFTPGLGRSLMAGYGLSSSGWNGVHDVSGRPGYAWYFGRDSVWACLAMLDYGDFRNVRQVLEFLGNHQEPTGKILHELTTSGFAHYDAADATPLYLVLLGRYVRMSGDRIFARAQFERVRNAVRFCFSTDTDRDHLIENTGVGHGWIEGGHLFPSHSEHYLGACWAEALKESSFLARMAGSNKLQKRWKREATRVRSALEKRFWNSENGCYRFALRPNGTFSDEKTVLSTVGMNFGCTHPGRSQLSLADFASEKFTTDWGVRIVGKDHAAYQPSGYHTGSIWPLFTGWTSLAEFKFHRPLQGYSHLLANTSLSSQFSGGCKEEVLHGEKFLPAGVCPHQAWSESMVLQPIFEGMLGLNVDAISMTLGLRPYIPPGWEILRVTCIPVGGASVNMTITRNATETVYSFTRRAARGSAKSIGSVNVVLEPLFPLGTTIFGATIDGKNIQRSLKIYTHGKLPRYELKLERSAKVRIRHQLGVALIVDSPRLVKGQSSTGLRVVDERWKRKTYEVVLEGRKGHEYLTDLYDPSGSVNGIEGGIALARKGSRVLVSISFAGESAEDAYVRGTLRFKT